MAQPPFTREKQKSEPLYNAAYCQFLLEPDFFQRTGFRICVPMVAAPLGAGSDNDSAIPANRPISHNSSNSISGLADVCGISKPWCMVSEQIKSEQIYALFSAFYYFTSSWLHRKKSTCISMSISLKYRWDVSSPFWIRLYYSLKSVEPDLTDSPPECHIKMGISPTEIKKIDM